MAMTRQRADLPLVDRGLARKRHYPAFAWLLLAASCGDDARDREFACQQRLVEIAQGGSARGAPLREAGTTFRMISEQLARMPLDGCTDRQRRSAGLLSRRALEVAAAFAPIDQAMRSAGPRTGDVRASLAWLERAYPAAGESRQFVELMVSIESFEALRQPLFDELERMKAERR